MIHGHEKAVLQFSGGKDSLACLRLLQPHWSELTVIWVDTGDSDPNVQLYVSAISELVKECIVVCSDQPSQQLRYGPPTDLLPVWNTEFGKSYGETRKNNFQTPFACCHENIWQPMAQTVKNCGATLVIRGQRNSEAKKSTIRSGYKEDGLEYWFPIENWSEVRVLQYLSDCGISLPNNYGYFNSSPDCLTCTAYLEENKGKVRWLRRFHPKAAALFRMKLTTIQIACLQELQQQTESLGEYYAS